MGRRSGKELLMVAQRQQPIVINAVIGEDHRLIVDLPLDGPTGNVMVMIAPTESPSPVQPSSDVVVNPERERLRAILLAAGKLGTAHMPEPGTVFPTEEEIRQAGIMPPGTPSSEETLRELRSDE
jgi:hypothetical protein